MDERVRGMPVDILQDGRADRRGTDEATREYACSESFKLAG